MFDLAGHVPGWSLDDARAFAWSLPGNVYSDSWQWAQAWSETFAWAIRLAPGTSVADEIDRALPTIIAQFARRPFGKTAIVPAEVARKFAIEMAVHIAARRIIANDLPGAERVLATAGGPLGAIAGSAPVGTETTHDANHDLELETMQALVAALGHQPVTLPRPAAREHGLLLVLGMMRPYEAAIRDRWTAALVSAGFPKPPRP